MDKVLVSEKRLLGAVARWSVEQSPYHRPDNLELVLDKLHQRVKNIFRKFPLGFAEFDHRGLINFVHDQLFGIPEYMAWNERKNGNQAPYGFTSRYEKGDDPDNDFIDLDALEMNVVRSLEADQ